MEMQNKPGPNGTPAYFPSPTPGVVVAPSNPVRVLSIILRGLAIVLVLTATIVMGVSKQTITVIVSSTDYSVLTDTSTAKPTDASAFTYFIVANAVVFVLSSIAFALTILNRSGSGNASLISIVDLVTVALLFSCNGAATAIRLFLDHSTDQLKTICSNFDKFCSKATAAVVLSMIASLAYVLLLLLSIIGSNRRSQ